LERKELPLQNDQVLHKKSFGCNHGHSSTYGCAVCLSPREEAEMGGMTVFLNMPPDGCSGRDFLCCYYEACEWHTLDEHCNGGVAVIKASSNP
jgi:hypothetical protein